MKNIFILTISALFLCSTAFAQTQTNNKVEVEDSDDDYDYGVGKEIDRVLSEIEPAMVKTNDEITEEDKEFKPTPEPDNFEYKIEVEDDESSTSSIFFLPECNDERFLVLVKDHITAYQNRYPANTVIGKRKQMLMLKKISFFEEISPENITSKDDFTLANEIITLKINNGISSQNLRVCKGPMGIKNSNLYIITYKDGNLVISKILNFAEPGATKRDLEFYY